MTVKIKFSLIILALSLISLFVFISDSLVVALLILIIIIAGMDISTDIIYESTDKFLVHKPGMLVGITLFAFITSLDEIFVSGSSIAEGYDSISLGTMLGSVTIGIVIFAISVLIIKKRQRVRSSAFMLIIPFFILILLFIDPYSLWYFWKLLVVILTVIFSIVFIFYTGIHTERDEDVRTTKDRGHNLILMVVSILILLILSLSMVRVTDLFGTYFHLGGVVSGFIIPGFLGTFPEFFAMKSSLKHGDSGSASGIIIGSSLMKGGIIFPVLAFMFAYNPADLIGLTIITIVPMLIGTLFLVFF